MMLSVKEIDECALCKQHFLKNKLVQTAICGKPIIFCKSCYIEFLMVSNPAKYLKKKTRLIDADELIRTMKERDDDNGGEPLNAVDRGYHLCFEHMCKEIEQMDKIEIPPMEGVE